MILTTIIMTMLTIGLLRMVFSLCWGITKLVFTILGAILSPLVLILMVVGTAGADLLALVVIAFLLYAIYNVIQNKEML